MRTTKLIAAICLTLVVAAPILAPFAGAASTVNLSAPGGAVIFTFDAGYASDVNVSTMLESHGFRGTFYIVSTFLHDGPYYSAFMSAQDVANLSARGHDIESHTKTHPDLTTVTDAQLATELADSQTTIQAITGKAVQHLAYPYDAWNARVQTATAARYASGRSLTTDVNAFTGVVNPYALPGLVIKQDTTLATAQSYVDFAIAHGTTVILSFQNILTTPGTWDWTPTQLNSLLTYTQSKTVTVKTIAALFSAAPPPPPSPGTIVFTFDDGQVNQIAAAQTLVDHGMRGTFYIVSNCPNSEVDADCMTRAQVQALDQAGHDVESHTVLHHDLTTLSASQLTNELSNSKSTLQTWIGKPVLHLAYPYGAHNANTRAQTATYYKTGRLYLTNPTPSSLPTLLAQSGSDRMLVPGIGVAAATTVARAEAYVDYAIAHNTTIVLVFHNIVTSGGDAYDWTPANLNTLVNYVASKHVTVKTMAQAYP